MHRMDKDTVCIKRMGDNKVPMYKEKSPARDTADQDQIQIVTEDKSDRRVLMYKEKLLARETADQGQIQTVTEDEGDSRVPTHEEKSLARRQTGTQTVYLCRVEDEFTQRREPH